MKTVKQSIEVSLPSYEEKYCYDIYGSGACPYFRFYDYGFKAECLISFKQIKIGSNDSKIKRPYGCRCYAKYGK